MIGWAIETLVATSLLMLLVLAIRAPVRRAFGAQMAYALWLLPVLRLLLPPLPGQWQLSSLLNPAVEQAMDAPGVVVGILDPATLPPEMLDTAGVFGKVALAGEAQLAFVPPTHVAGAPSPLLLLMGLWAIGALAFLAYHLASHRRYTAHLLRQARIDRTVAQGRVRVIETDAAHGPLAFGVFRKYVAFPRDFAERYDAQERDLALAHELGHHVRGDLIANWVALLVLALHWFNPIAWRAFRAFRADQEMACDALVLAGRARALRHAYGRAIVKSAHGGAVSAACHLHTINDVKGRLRMLSKTRSYSPARLAIGLVGIGAVGLAGLALTASSTQAAETIKSKVETTIGASLAQDMPAPPAPPAAGAAAAPAAAPAPQAPPAPPQVRVVHVQDGPRAAGKDPKRIKKMVIVRGDGSTSEVQMPDMDAIRLSIPEIRDGKCGTGADRAPTVIHREEKGRKIMIICSDRIETAAANAERFAFAHRAMGLESARMGLRMARRSIEGEANMTAEERAKALKEIDEAMAELDQQAED